MFLLNSTIQSNKFICIISKAFRNKMFGDNNSLANIRFVILPYVITISNIIQNYTEIFVSLVYALV